MVRDKETRDWAHTVIPPDAMAVAPGDKVGFPGSWFAVHEALRHLARNPETGESARTQFAHKKLGPQRRLGIYAMRLTAQHGTQHIS